MPLRNLTFTVNRTNRLNLDANILTQVISTQRVNDALKGFQDQILNQKLKLGKSIEEIKSFLDDDSVSIDELNNYISTIDKVLEVADSLLSLIDSYFDYYESYGAYSTGISDFHNQIPKIKLNMTSTVSQIRNIKNQLIKSFANNHASRVELDVDNAIDWDETPTIYQATTIAHGHLLCFRLRLKADGYSLGEVKYSKSLGPCEKEQVAILDWSRTESSSRMESTISRENFSASFSRDRDINEVINSSLSESIKGKSLGVTAGHSSGGSVGGSGSLSASYPPGGAQGKAGVGGLLSSFTSIGVSGSVASQKATRSMSSNLQNKLRDRINQSAQAVRSQRSIVIQSVSQNERVSATTKVIANKNLCFPVNFVFSEIVKIYAIEQELVDVRECLFIPMKITPFDAKKAIRWKTVLYPLMPTMDLRLGFEALNNIENNTPSQNDFLSNELIQDFVGQLSISFDIPLPAFQDPKEDESNDDWRRHVAGSSWPFWYDNFLSRPYGGGLIGFYQTWFWRKLQQEKIKTWEEKFVPIIVREFIEDLQIVALDGTIETPLEIDVTQISKYRKSLALNISLNISPNTPNIRRSDIKKVKIFSSFQVPNESKIILHSGALSYRSSTLNEFIFKNHSIKNDMVNKDSVLLVTPLNERELVNPKRQETERANKLLTFLNDHLTEMHQFIFAGMNSNTRFMMLDGIKLNAAGGRSVSSIVENEIVDIVGNSIVMPVAAGLRIDPVFRSQENLLDIYKTEKTAPFRISLPTGGYFMEAVQGSCNACEDLDYTKARFHGFGCTDEPTPIQELSTDTRRSDPGNLQAKDLPTNIVNFQTVPHAPSPTDLSSVFTMLGKGDSFRDLSGLSENQKNALAALTKTADSAVDMGRMTTDLVKTAMAQNLEKTIDRDLDRINKEKAKGNLTDDEASDLTRDALTNKNKLNKPSGEDQEPESTPKPDMVAAANKSLDKGASKVKVKNTNKDGSSQEVEIEKQPGIQIPTNLSNNWSSLSSFLGKTAGDRKVVAIKYNPVETLISKTNDKLNFLGKHQYPKISDRLKPDYWVHAEPTLTNWIRKNIGNRDFIIDQINSGKEFSEKFESANPGEIDEFVVVWNQEERKALGYKFEELLVSAVFQIDYTSYTYINSLFRESIKIERNNNAVIAATIKNTTEIAGSANAAALVGLMKLGLGISGKNTLETIFSTSATQNINIKKAATNIFDIQFNIIGRIKLEFTPFAKRVYPSVGNSNAEQLQKIETYIPVIFEIEETNKQLA